MQNLNLCKFPKSKPQRRADEEKKNIFTVKGGIVECFCFDAFLFSFLFISYFLLYYTFFALGWESAQSRAREGSVNLSAGSY